MKILPRISVPILSLCFLGSLPGQAQAQSRVEENVVYGMHSGLALLMDVHYSDQPNGLGIVYIAGSGWHENLSYDANGLKIRAMIPQLGGPALVESGYTVFAINHRAAPRFRYPDAVEDARRAVRFIRRNSSDYGVDPLRLGAVGASSGAHLALMLGVLDDDSSIDRRRESDESSRVQAVVALAAATDFPAFVTAPISNRENVASFLGALYNAFRDPESAETRLYQEASPVTHVTADDAPVLMVHGEMDTIAPYSQSEIMLGELQKAGIAAELIGVPGAGHSMGLDGQGDPPDLGREMARWFDTYLKRVE